MIIKVPTVAISYACCAIVVQRISVTEVNGVAPMPMLKLNEEHRQRRSNHRLPFESIHLLTKTDNSKDSKNIVYRRCCCISTNAPVQ